MISSLARDISWGIKLGLQMPFGAVVLSIFLHTSMHKGLPPWWWVAEIVAAGIVGGFLSGVLLGWARPALDNWWVVSLLAVPIGALVIWIPVLLGVEGWFTRWDSGEGKLLTFCTLITPAVWPLMRRRLMRMGFRTLPPLRSYQLGRGHALRDPGCA